MKKWIMALLSAICVLCGTLGLVACGVGEGATGGHTFSTDYKHTIDYHWHYCTDDKTCKERSQYERHNLELIETYEGRKESCGKNGRGVFQCVDCGVTIEDVIPATGKHEYILVQETKPASCFDDGEGLYACTNCDVLETRVIPATGDHTYIDGKWTMSKDGHESTCEVCHQSTGLVEHTKVRDTKNSHTVDSSGTNDGIDVFVCEVCGYVIDRNILPNPNVPNSLTVQLMNGTTIQPITQRANGDYEMVAALGVSYTARYTATYPSGKTATVQEAIMAADPGVRAYLLDTYTENPTKLDVQNSSKVMYLDNKIRTQEEGEFLVSFRYETGYADWTRAWEPLYGDDYNSYKVRAEFRVWLITGTTSAASISALGVQSNIIVDGIECLAIGAYEDKNR